MTGHNTYSGAPDALIARWEKRRAPMDMAPGETLEPDTDLATLATRTIADLPAPPAGASRHAVKRHEIARDMPGQSELALLHALVVAHLRKRTFPPDASALFHRIWREQGAALLALPTRWLISAAITFGDHGESEAQRLLGRETGMLFSLMKLTEFERLFSGLPPTKAHRPDLRADADLPMGMTPFSLTTGGLDINLLAPLWAKADRVPLVGPVVGELLRRLNADPGTIFARLAQMRAEKTMRKDRRRAGSCGTGNGQGVKP